MRRTKLISFVAGCMLAAIAGSAAMPAFAQSLPGVGSLVGLGSALSRIPILSPGELNPVKFDIEGFFKKQLSKSCDALAAVDEVLKAAQVVNMFGGLALITNNASLIHELTAKDAALTLQINCRDQMYRLADAWDPGAIYYKQDKQDLLGKLRTEKQTLQTQRTQIENQLVSAQQGFWKAVVFGIIKRAGAAFQRVLAGKIQSTLGISRVGNYVDALASAAYTGQRIAAASDSKSEQMLIHSLITNPVVPGEIHPTAIAQAMKYAGGDCDATVDVTATDFYQTMYRCGQMSANPLFNQLSAEDKAAAASADAKQRAAAEVALGNGYKAPQNCAGNVVEQNNIDAQYKVTQAKFENRKAQYYTLLANKKTDPKDLQKALKDYIASANEVVDAPEKLESPVLTLCEAMAYPAKSVDDLLSHIMGGTVDSLNNFDGNNLPFYIGYIGDVALNLGQKFLLGSNTGTVINEQGLLTHALGDGINITATQIKQGLDENSVEPSSLLSQNITNSGSSSNTPPSVSGGGTSSPPATTPPSATGSGTGAPGGNTGGGIQAFIRGVTRVLGVSNEAPVMPRGVGIEPRGPQS